MSKKSKHRPRSFSKAFDKWLRWCEHFEDWKDHRRNSYPDMAYHEAFFDVRTRDENTMVKLISRSISNAKLLRSAMKFRFDYPLHDAWVPEDTPIALPFPVTYCEIRTGDAEDSPTIMLIMEERIADTSLDEYSQQYCDVGIHPGTTFICVHIAGHSTKGELSMFPVEMHIPVMQNLVADDKSNLRSLSAFPEGVDGKKFVEQYSPQVLEFIACFMYLCHHPKVQKTRVAGMPREAAAIVRKHRRKPMESTFYEHHVLEIPVGDDMEYEASEGTPGARHRLHAVRGHMRRYKTGKTVWVQSHWRGDKDLGVVTKDYDFVEKEDGEEES